LEWENSTSYEPWIPNPAFDPSLQPFASGFNDSGTASYTIKPQSFSLSHTPEQSAIHTCDFQPEAFPPLTSHQEQYPPPLTSKDTQINNDSDYRLGTPGVSATSSQSAASPGHLSQKESSTSKVQKRKLNTAAARRYRQKRLDQVSSLEAELKKTQLERDELKIRVAKLEGEADVLRRLVGDRGQVDL